PGTLIDGQVENESGISSVLLPGEANTDRTDIADPSNPEDSGTSSLASLGQDLSQDDKDKVAHITSEVLTSQLASYSWVKGSAAKFELRSIRSYKNYDYDPAVFYVDKEDFDEWLARDGQNHFFEWQASGSPTVSKSGPTGRSLFLTQRTYVCHRSGCKRINKPKPKVDPVAKPEDEDIPVINGTPLPKKTRKQQRLALLPVLENEESENEGAENEGNENKEAEQHSSDDEAKDSGQRKKRNAKGSMKVGCMAKLLVYEPKDMKKYDPEYIQVGGREQLRVVCFYKHTGHTLGNFSELRYMRLTDAMKRRISYLIGLGLTNRRIREKLGLAGDQVFNRMYQGTLRRDHFITYEDVYNLYKFWAARTELATEDDVSMLLWLRKLEREKQFTVFNWEK
ncbi:hypothetical protein BGX20_006713, partial [Mortierella sp. AD010]